MAVGYRTIPACFSRLIGRRYSAKRCSPSAKATLVNQNIHLIDNNIMINELISKVWKIAGLVGKVVPGVLVWKNNEVIFITEEGIQFQTPVSGISNIKYPFLRMGMGFDLVVKGEKYKFSLAKPNSSAPEIDIVKGNPFPKVVYAGFYVDDVSSLMDIKENKLTTKKWKEILSSKS